MYHGKKTKNPKLAAIKPHQTIHDRSQIVEEHIRLGDWEGDTIIGSEQKSAFVTLVDRTTRFLVAGIIPNRKASSVNKMIINLLNDLPSETITLDRGSEFALFRDIEQELDINIYFADAYSPWQRGSNENINRLLRQFYPKGTDFLEVSCEELDRVVKIINERPRKCLGWLTPYQVFHEKMLHLN